MAGYFQADRSITKALLPECGSRYTEAEAYIYLSSFAAFAPRDVMTNGKLISLNVGELVASERYLEKAWSWSRSKVRNFKKLLTGKGLLNQREDQQETILIVDFIRLQEPQGTTERTTNQTKVEPPENHPRTKIIKKKKEKGEKKSQPLKFADEDNSEPISNHPQPTHEEVMKIVGSTTYPLPPECAEAYFLNREAVGWMKKGQAIANWRADLALFSNHWMMNERSRISQPQAEQTTVNEYLG